MDTRQLIPSQSQSQYRRENNPDGRSSTRARGRIDTTSNVSLAMQQRQEASFKKKISTGLSRYGYDKERNERIAAEIIEYPEAVHMNPSILAGAIYIYEQAELKGISPLDIDLPLLKSDVDFVLNRGGIISVSIPNNQRQKVITGIKADLLRYINFLYSKRDQNYPGQF